VELKGSCKALSIDSGRCLAFDKPDLQDNPKVWWDEAAITAVVRDYVAKWKVDVVSSSRQPYFGPYHLLTLLTRFSHSTAAVCPAILITGQ
jgi:hypothetical protein